MKLIETITPNGDSLYGILYGEKYKDTCVIITNGHAGNIFENRFLRVVGEVLEKNKISFLYAHNSGAFQMINTFKSKRHSGQAFERFDDCVDELAAYVNYAKQSGYKHIILGGHSYGTNKVVYYLSQTQTKDVEKYILIGPYDTLNLQGSEADSKKELLPIAQKFIKEKNENAFLPKLFGDWCLFTAGSFLDFVNNTHNKNLLGFNENADFSQLESIKQQGLFVTGEFDVDCGGKDFSIKFLNNCKAHAGNKTSVTKIISATGHTYRGEEKSTELANCILNFVNNKF